MVGELVQEWQAGGCGGNHSGSVVEIGRASPEDIPLEKPHYLHGDSDVELE